jgi:hypothetical protein
MSAVVPSPPLLLTPRSDDEEDDDNNDWTASGDDDRSRAAIGVNLGYFMVLMMRSFLDYLEEVYYCNTFEL